MLSDQKRVDEAVERVPDSESIAATRAIVEEYDGESHEFPLSRRKVMELCDNIEALRAALRESQRRVEVLGCCAHYVARLKESDTKLATVLAEVRAWRKSLRVDQHHITVFGECAEIAPARDATDRVMGGEL